MANGLQRGTDGEPNSFIGPWTNKGLYASTADPITGEVRAFFGTGGTKKQMKSAGSQDYHWRPGIPASTTFAMYVPDLQNLINGTLNVRGVTNRALNNSYSGMDNMLGQTATRFITEPWGTDISNGYLTPSNFNSKYYIASKRPKLTWLDINNYPTFPQSPGTPTYIPPNDIYYKGRWTIYVDISGGSDTSGCIYLSNSNRAIKPAWTGGLYNYFTNSGVGPTDEISNVFVDLDLDVSRNVPDVSDNYNNIYSKPWYVFCSDASDNIFYGTVPFGDPQEQGGIWQVLPNIGGLTTGAKYCKIRINSFSPNVEWHEAQWHICYYSEGDNYLAYANGKADTALENKYLWDNIDYVGEFSGLYPSMEIDSNGNPHIAFLGTTQLPYDANNAIHYISGNTSLPTDATANPGQWNWTMIDPSMGNVLDGGYYSDLSNNQPINLKISPIDDSVHICYQKKNDDGTYSIKYWTNSTNLKDISGVDSSLNYLGIRSQGKTLDISAAYVELTWDLSSSKCIFSRDYTRIDSST